ncbi:antitoxin [Candidatus Roizmanbacteria bacterium CG03_land_8_20_14_0_80_35_26]|uniref:Antitoxin n=1 Tax=Candidatus Roizmanbacteria bacterium CG03_land_8_20_14_0_80_35_26 TaxID=1974845 RepID=A0A2M7BWG3_9BACT|nr:MAG: antitoxin [Candidatus Roizmanbacteria bacterium CG03_land_8_20_14_0_80_35_26]
MKDYKLDKEELQILRDVEAGKYKSVANLKEEIKRAREAAKNTLQKTKNINIRLSERDIQKLKVKAAENNLPYQTLISMLLRQYTKGEIRITL